jgi:HSP20 family protein
MDDIFHSLLSPWPLQQENLWPAIDVHEEEDAFTVKAEVPGCKADDINISVHGNIISISGEKKQQEEKKEKGYYHVERSHGSFKRNLSLSTDVDTTRIDATCKDGVLKITLPKAETAKAVKVKVKS